MKPTVIDFFCGAGGYSEGFRQQGFEIVLGIDRWKPAIDTFNHNFGKSKGVLKNILDFDRSVEEIEALPNTDVIIGSPPCVSFSHSNRSGKADKSLGIKLTETFLKIVVVKKHQPNSILKAWFMENVEKSIYHIQPEYSFADLSLSEWAKKNNLHPDSNAITIKGNFKVLNSADYGSPQQRLRAIYGEIISCNKLIIPEPTHRPIKDQLFGLTHLPLKIIKDTLPSPSSKKSNSLIQDPLYNIELPMEQLTDHFYDTGLYECEWEDSKFLKTNHPYMGVMSFPENEMKPSRTITATKIGTSRESIIYRSEYNRKGNGEFRTPTIREAACIMGFPITYQFLGSENTKWRLIGNAVCPSISRTLAKIVREDFRLKKINTSIVIKDPNLKGVIDLNSFNEKKFTNPPKRIPGSRFRRHPFKDGNITVTLSNYHIQNNKEANNIRRWITSVQYGNGEGFPTFEFKDQYYEQLEPIIKKFENGNKFLEIINNGFSEKIANSEMLQTMHEIQKNKKSFLKPTKLIEKTTKIIDSFKFSDPNFDQGEMIIFKDKMRVPKKQVLALYAINKIATIANN
jgi:DNA (cytosine-5)-methyltransferase 1